jgi:hypothetical protein
LEDGVVVGTSQEVRMRSSLDIDVQKASPAIRASQTRDMRNSIAG